MSFLASSIQSDLEFMVDDENSSRYNFAADYVHAINAGIKHVVAILDSAFEQKLLSPTILGELMSYRSYSYVTKSDVAHITVTTDVATYIWRIIGIDPEPVLEETTPFEYMTSIGAWATFIPFNEWGNSFEDPFSPGASGIAADLKRFAYTQVYIEEETTYVLQLLLKPKPTATKVGILMLLNPVVVTATGDIIKLPLSVHQIVTNKAYEYLMRQAGPEAQALIQVSDKEVKELVSLFKT